MPSHDCVIWAVIPVKNFTTAKSRLGSFLGASDRQRLARAMAADVIEAVQQSQTADRLFVLSDSASTQELASQQQVSWIDETRITASPGLNTGIKAMARTAAEADVRALMVVHADLPLLCAADLRHMVSVWRSLEGDQRAVMARSSDGGTNILLVERPHAFSYQFGRNSHEHHLLECTRRGRAVATVELPGTALDIDNVDDFERLAQAADAGRCGKHTAALLQQLLPAMLFPFALTRQEAAS